MTALGRLGESNRFRASLCGSPHPADSLAALLSLVLVSVKLSDLGVDLVDLAHPRRIRFTKTHSRHALDRRPSDLPSVDHRLTHAMLGRQLGNRLLATHHVKRRLGLEVRRMPLPPTRHRVRALVRANQA